MSDLSTDDLQELAELEKLLPANMHAQIKMLKHVIIGLKRKLKVENEAHMAVRRELCNYFADSDTTNSSMSTRGKGDHRTLAEIGSAEEKLISVKAELASLTSKYGDLYRNLIYLREQYEALRKSDEDKTQKITELTSQLEQSEKSALSMHEEIGRTKELHAKIEKDNDQLQAENIKLKSELSSTSYLSDKNTADLKTQLSQVSAELAVIKEAHNRLSLENEKLYDKLRAADDSNRASANAEFRRELDSKVSEIVRLTAELETTRKECATIHAQYEVLQVESKTQISQLTERSAYELSRLRTEYEDKLTSERKQADNSIDLQAEKHSLALAAEAARHDKEKDELKQDLKRKQAELDLLTKQVGDGRRALLELRTRRQADADQFSARMKMCKILLEEYQARLIASGETIDPRDCEQLNMPLYEVPDPVRVLPAVDPNIYTQGYTLQHLPVNTPESVTNQPIHNQQLVQQSEQQLHNAVQFVDPETSTQLVDTVDISVKSSIIEQNQLAELFSIDIEKDADELTYEISVSDLYLKRDLLPADILETIHYIFVVVHFWDFQPLVSRAIEFNGTRRQLQLELGFVARNLSVTQNTLFALYLETRAARVEVYGAGPDGARLLGTAGVPLGGLLGGCEAQVDAPLARAGAEVGRVAARVTAGRALRDQE